MLCLRFSVPLFKLVGGTYGTIYHQTLITSAPFISLAIRWHVRLDPLATRRAGAGDLQSSSKCSRSGGLACPFWLGSAGDCSVLQMARKCLNWQLWHLDAHLSVRPLRAGHLWRVFTLASYLRNPDTWLYLRPFQCVY